VKILNLLIHSQSRLACVKTIRSLQQYLILDSVIKKLNLRGVVSLKLKQIVAYADDVALLARSLKALKEIFHKLKNEVTLVGLSISEERTKYMQIKRTGIKVITHLKIYNL